MAIVVRNRSDLKKRVLRLFTPCSNVNWDSCLFSWRTKRLHLAKGYLGDLQKGYLDVVLSDNPNYLGVLVRIIRYYMRKQVKIFSSNLACLVLDGINNYSADDVISYEWSSYDHVYINRRVIGHLERMLVPHVCTGKSVVLGVYERNGSFFDSDLVSCHGKSAGQSLCLHGVEESPGSIGQGAR